MDGMVPLKLGSKDRAAVKGSQRAKMRVKRGRSILRVGSEFSAGGKMVVQRRVLAG